MTDLTSKVIELKAHGFSIPHIARELSMRETDVRIALNRAIVLSVRNDCTQDASWVDAGDVENRLKLAEQNEVFCQAMMRERRP